jgi:hypothetical protein
MHNFFARFESDMFGAVRQNYCKSQACDMQT